MITPEKISALICFAYILICLIILTIKNNNKKLVNIIFLHVLPIIALIVCIIIFLMTDPKISQFFYKIFNFTNRNSIDRNSSSVDRNSINENFEFKVSKEKQKCLDDSISLNPQNKATSCNCNKDHNGRISNKYIPNTSVTEPTTPCNSTQTTKKTNNSSIAEVFKTNNVTMYIMDKCPACKSTKELLSKNNLLEHINILNAKEHIDYLKSKNVTGVPYIETKDHSSTGLPKSIDDLLNKLNLNIPEPTSEPTTETTSEPTTETTSEPTTETTSETTTEPTSEPTAKTTSEPEPSQESVQIKNNQEQNHIQM